MYRIAFSLALAAALLVGSPLVASPITVNGNMAASTSHIGDFTGTLTYGASDATHATLTLSLTNTTPAGGGYLTGFVLNNPGNAISGITFSSTNANFGLLGLSSNTVSGGPFGRFDFGASTGGGFEGGGPPSKGVGVGSSATFTFTLTGTGLNLLNEQSFMNELSVGPEDGSGHKALVVRFRGIDLGPTSDKVPGDPKDTPEPSTLLLSLVALGGIIPVWRARRRSA